MIFFKKYSLVLYILLTIFMVYSLSPLKSYESILNIVLIGIGLILGFLFRQRIFSGNFFFLFRIILLYLLFNFLYQITFGWLDFKIEDILYLLAKTSFVFILIVSITTNFDYYFKNNFFYIGFFILLLVIMGYLFSERSEGGRLYLGFANPNEAGALSAIGFGIFLLHPDFKIYIRLFGMAVLLLALIMTGSRSALIISFLSTLFYFKFDFRIIIPGSIFLLVIFYVIPILGFEAIGVNRLISSFITEDGSFVSNRESEFEIGLLMFKNKFWTGYGLTGYRIIDESLVTSDLEGGLGTHNGYLAAAKMYGVFFLIPFLYLMLIKPFFIIKNLFNNENKYLKVHLFVVVAVLIGAGAEDYLIGVNSFVTILFFLSLAIIEVYNKSFLKNNLI